jgi:hemoglobin
LKTDSDFSRLGGFDGLKPLVRKFIQRVMSDTIIGFFFDLVDQEQLIAREVEFAARHLGGPDAYTGKPIARSHKPHPINRGHFHRRLWILEEVLKEEGVPEDIRERWLEHNRLLEPAVTNGTECVE